jgi:hypothetical protein
MKNLLLLLLSISLASLFAGCGEKSDKATTESAATEQAEETKDTGNNLISGLKESIKEVATEAEELAEAVVEETEEATAETKETVEQVEEAVTEESGANTEAVEETAKASTGLLGAATAAATEQTDALTSDLAEKASSLLSEYTGKISTLSGSVKELEPLIKQAAGALSPQLTQSYNELKNLLPELSTMIASLKNYQGTDLANVTSKIQADYTEAEGLYKKVLELMPQKAD